MISQTQRFCFICELGVKTIYGRFPAPSAESLFAEIARNLDLGADFSTELGARKYTLTKMSKSGDIVAILFRMTDPDIPDNILENTDDQTLHIFERGEGQVPAVSVHLLVDVSSNHDAKAAYPLCIENVVYLSKSAISYLLNKILSDLFTEKRRVEDNGPMKTYSPRFEIRGHQSKTIKNILLGDGKLCGLKMVTNIVQEDGFGEPAYPVTNSSEIHLAIAGKPGGIAAIDWLRRKVEALRNNGLDSARVTIEGENGRSKTTKLDLSKQDVTSNYFILQEVMNGFDELLVICEEEIRDDVVSKMTRLLPNA